MNAVANVMKSIKQKMTQPVLTKVVASTKSSPTAVSSNKITIDWLNKIYGLSQVYSSGLEYCFISKDRKQVCAFMLCKDFLQDALMAQHNNSKVNIYNFTYDAKKDNPIDLEHTRLAIANSLDAKMGEKIPAMLNFIHQIERKLKLIRATCQKVENPPKKYEKCGVYVIEASNRWMRSPPMISLFSLLIRVGFTHKVGDTFETTIDNLIKKKSSPYQTNDASQIAGAKEGLNTILKHGYAKVFFNDPKQNFPSIPEHNMHYNMGIVAFTSGLSKPHVKHWHRDLNKKPKKKEPAGEQTESKTSTKTTRAKEGAAL